MPEATLAELKTLSNTHDVNGVLSLLPDGWEASYSGSELAMRHYYRAVALARRADRAQGDTLAWGDEMELAYRLLHTVSDSTDACWVVVGQAYRLNKMGDHESAAEVVRVALDQYDPKGEQLGYVKWHLGWNVFHSGDTAGGLVYMEQAVALLQEFGQPVDASYAALDVARCLCESGEYGDSLRRLLSLETQRGSRKAKFQAQYDNDRARCLLGLGRIDEAHPWILSAITTATDANNENEKAMALCLAAEYARCKGGPTRTLAELAIDQGILSKHGEVVRRALELKHSGEVSQ